MGTSNNVASTDTIAQDGLDAQTAMDAGKTDSERMAEAVAQMEAMRADFREALHWLSGSSCGRERRFAEGWRKKWGLE